VLRGEHDIATSTALEASVGELLPSTPFLVVDVSPAEFVDSTTVRALILACRAAEAAGSEFALVVGPQSIVRRTLEIAGVLEQLHAAETLDHALQRDGSPIGRQR
jgi:anti-anti-sigma factor